MCFLLNEIERGDMRKLILALSLFTVSGVAYAQWAVLDEEVRKLVEHINKVQGSGKTLSSFDPQSGNIGVKSCLLPYQKPFVIESLAITSQVPAIQCLVSNVNA